MTNPTALDRLALARRILTRIQARDDTPPGVHADVRIVLALVDDATGRATNAPDGNETHLNQEGPP